MSGDFPEKGMTFVQFVQHVIPGISDEQADHILWEETPFPLAQGRDDLLPYLEKARARTVLLNTNAGCAS